MCRDIRLRVFGWHPLYTKRMAQRRSDAMSPSRFVLPAFANNADRPMRVEREACTLAALNHPEHRSDRLNVRASAADASDRILIATVRLSRLSFAR
jgi:hypothetical protein